jgi:regulator of sirC expression with transglutaminase-like and TPR domain
MQAAPRHCRTEAFEAFAREVRDLERADALLRAAIAISMHERPSVDMEQVIARVEELAERVRGRVRTPNDDSRLAHLHAVLFDEEGFRGDTQDYDAPRNSYLGDLLRRRRGLPITLSLVYAEVGRRVGLDIRGIHAPGHFFASVLTRGQPMFVDPFFGGKALTRDEALQRVTLAIGGPLPPGVECFREATARMWLARMLANLGAAFERRKRPDDVAAMLELNALLERRVA